MKQFSIVVAATIGLAACAATAMAYDPCDDGNLKAGENAFTHGEFAGAITAFYPLAERGYLLETTRVCHVVPFRLRLGE